MDRSNEPRGRAEERPGRRLHPEEERPGRRLHPEEEQPGRRLHPEEERRGGASPRPPQAREPPFPGHDLRAEEGAV